MYFKCTKNTEFVLKMLVQTVSCLNPHYVHVFIGGDSNLKWLKTSKPSFLGKSSAHIQMLPRQATAFNKSHFA